MSADIQSARREERSSNSRFPLDNVHRLFGEIDEVLGQEMIQTGQQGEEMSVEIFVGVDFLGLLPVMTFAEDLQETEDERVEEFALLLIEIDQDVFSVEREEIENDLHLIAVIVIEVQEIEYCLQSGLTVFEEIDDLAG